MWRCAVIGKNTYICVLQSLPEPWAVFGTLPIFFMKFFTSPFASRQTGVTFRCMNPFSTANLAKTSLWNGVLSCVYLFLEFHVSQKFFHANSMYCKNSFKKCSIRSLFRGDANRILTLPTPALQSETDRINQLRPEPTALLEAMTFSTDLAWLYLYLLNTVSNQKHNFLQVCPFLETIPWILIVV